MRFAFFAVFAVFAAQAANAQLAVTVNPPDIVINANNDVSVSANASGTSLASTYVWTVERGGRSCIFPRTPATFVDWTATVRGGGAATLVLAAASTPREIGTHCLRLKICERGTSTCALSPTFNLEVRGLQPVHDYVYPAGDDIPLVVPVVAQPTPFPASASIAHLTPRFCPGFLCFALQSWMTRNNPATTDGDVKLFPDGAVAVGDYGLRVSYSNISTEAEPNDTRQQANPANAGAALSASLTSGAIDHFGIHANASTTVKLVITNVVAGESCPTVSFVDGAGTVLASAGSACTVGGVAAGATVATVAARDIIAKLTGGLNATAYTVTMSTVSGSTTSLYQPQDFAIRIIDGPGNARESEPNDATNQPDAAFFSNPVTASLSTATDKDRFSFTGGTQEIAVQTFGLNGVCPGNTRVTLQQTGLPFTTLSVGDDIDGSVCGGVMGVAVDAGSTYHALVDSPTGSVVNNYRVAVANVFDNAPGVFLNDYTVMGGFLLGSATDSVSLFSVAPGDLIGVRVTGNDNDCPGALGLKLRVTNNSLGQEDECTAWPQGTNIIDVAPDAGTSTCGAFIGADVLPMLCGDSQNVDIEILVSRSGRGFTDYYVEFTRDRATQKPVINSSSDDAVSVAYGTCFGTAEVNLDARAANANAYAIYEATSTTGDPASGIGISDAFGDVRFPEARLFVEDADTSLSFDHVFRWHPTATTFAAQTSVTRKFHMAAQTMLLAATSRSDSAYPSSRTGLEASSIFAIDATSTGNDLQWADSCDTLCNPDGCNFFGPDGCGVAQCALTTDAFKEGERVRIHLTRFNAFTTTTLERCTALNTGCSTSNLLGAAFDGVTNRFSWDIPDNFSSAAATTTAFFRVRSTDPRSIAAETSTSLVINVAQVADPVVANPDLRPIDVFGSTNFSTLPRLRSLAARDSIFVSAFGPSSTTTVSTTVRNFGGASSAATTNLRVFLTDGVTGADGRPVFPAPVVGATPYRTVAVPTLAAGAEATVTFIVNGVDGTYSAGGFSRLPRGLWVEAVATAAEPVGNRINNLQGPYELKVGFPVPISTAKNMSGALAAITPASPKSGDVVSVPFFISTNKPMPTDSPIELRVYDDLATTPDVNSVANETQLLLPGQNGDAQYLHTFTAQKPNRASNAVSVRVFIDATDLVDETNENDNHLPSVAAAQSVVIANSAPTYASTPATTSFSEGQTFTYTVQVADADDVDIDRMTIAFQGAVPGALAFTGAATSSGSFPNRRRQRTMTWTFSDADTIPGSASFTLRACDGDPIAQSCVDQPITLTLTRLNDAPILQTAASPIAATEDTALGNSVTLAVSDEEGSALSFVVVAQPPGNGMTLTPTNCGAGQTTTGASLCTVRVDWTPGDAAVGNGRTATIKVQETATPASNAPQVLTFNVANVNDRPVLGAPSVTSVAEDSVFASVLNATDADNDISGVGQTFICSKTGGPSWLTVSTDTVSPTQRRCLLGASRAITDVDVGSTSTSIFITDSSASGTAASLAQTFNVVVTNVNDTPVFQPDAPAAGATLSLTENQLFTLSFGVRDDDLLIPSTTESLVADTTTPITGLIVSSGAAVAGVTPVTVTWTPDDNQPGSRSFVLRIRDGAGAGVTVTRTWTLNVANVNDLPVFAPPQADVVRTEGQSFSGTLVATDADITAGLSDTVTFSLISGAPSGFTVAPNGAMNLGATDDAQVGVFNITVRASDLTGFTDDVFRLTVTNVAEAPGFGVFADQQTNEDAPYTRTVTATDPDAGDVITYSLVTPPAGMSINPTTGVISFTPVQSQVTPGGQLGLIVTVKATDNSAGLLNSSTTYRLKVINAPDAPVITSSRANVTLAQNATFSYTLTATDEDTAVGDVITLSAQQKPAFLSFTPATGVLTGTLNNAAVGVHTISLRATDVAGAVDNASFTLTVTNVNDAPVIASVGGFAANGAIALSVNEGAALSATVVAADIDVGDHVAYSFDATTSLGVPVTLTDAQVDPITGVFTFNPTFVEAGSYLVTFFADDDFGASDQETVTVTVGNVNRAPRFTATPPATATEDVAFAYTATAVDDDGTAVTWSLVTAPVGMGINSGTGAISWLPGNGDVGNNSVRVRVSDGSLTADQVFTLNVLNVNDAPTITSTAPTTATEGVLYSYTLAASDIDVPAQTLTFTINKKPSWLSFNAATKVLSGTPDDPDLIVDNQVIIVANDGVTNSATQVFTIVITPVNDAPVFSGTTPANASIVTFNEGSAGAFTMQGTDAEGSALTFGMTGQPPGSTLVGGVFSWTPNFSDAGDRPVTLTISDGTASGTPRAITLRVLNTDRAPTVSAPATATVNEGVATGFTVSGADADGDAVTLSLVSGPAGAVFTAATGAFTFTPDFVGGTRVVNAVFKATANGLDSSTATTAITVTQVNLAPTLGAPSSTSATQGALFTATLTAADADLAAPGDTLTFTKVSGPSSLVVSKTNATTATVTYTPSAAEVPSQNVVVRATDAGGLFADRAFTLTVTNVPDAPTFTSSAITVATQDVAYSYTPTTFDADAIVGDTVTVSAITKPAWLSFAAGVLSGTPTNADVGSHNVTLRATDSTARTVDQSFVVVVANVNDAPVLAAIGNRAVAELATLTFTVSAVDPDGTTPVFSTSSLAGLPGAVFTAATRTFSWTPGAADAGNYDVTFTASDGALSDSETITITVGNVNRPPDLAFIADVTANEGQTINFVTSAIDPDFDVVALSAVGDPVANPFTAGASFTAATGTFNWVTDFTDAGVYLVTFVASDGNGGLDSQVVVVTVQNTNRAPSFVAPTPAGPNVAGAENALVSFTLTGTDPDGQALTFSSTALPAGASLNSSSGAFAWTPSFAQAGSFPITFTVSDGSLTANRLLTLVIANTDRPPVISAPATSSVNEGVALAFTVTASDPDGDAVTLSLTTSPAASATFTAATGAFSYTPAFNEQGTRTATFQANAGGLTASTSTTITVNQVNQAPTLGAPSATAATQGVAFTATLTGADVDIAAPGDTLTYSLVTAPATMSVTKVNATTARLDWLPGTLDVNPASRTVVVRATDAGGLTGDRTFTLTIANVNDAPVLAQPANASLLQNQTFTTTLSATDADVDAGLADTLTFSLTTAPAGMTVNASTGVITFATDNSRVGVHNVTGRVVDTAGLSSSKSFTVTVTNINDAPTITSTAPVTTAQSAAFSYTLTAADIDVGDTLTFSAPVLPSWLSFNATTRVLSGTPAQADVGNHAVTLRVADAGGLAVNQSFTLAVTNVNDAPVLAPIGNQAVPEGQLLSFVVAASDIDGTVPTLSAAPLPPGASFNAATGAFSWTTAFGDAGSFPVTFTASDGSLSDTEVVVITVGNVNRAPDQAPIGAKTVAEGSLLSFTVTASDPDGNPLTFSATGLPAGATFSTTTHVFSYTPGFADAGSVNVTFTTSDGTLSDSEVVTITVTNTNRAPSFSVTPPTTTAEDAAFAFVAGATDADGDAVSHALITAPAGMGIVAATGALSWTPVNNDVGPHTVTVRATDGKGGSTDLSFGLAVTNTNDAPIITSSPLTTATEDQAYSLVVAASDVDVGASLTFSAPTRPAWLSFNPATQTLSGTPREADVGSHNVVVRVTDGIAAAVDQAFVVIVAPVNDAPAFTAPTVTTQTVAEGATLAFTLIATDSDGPSAPTFSATGLPATATLNATTGAFSYTPGFNEAGTRVITFSASDSLLSTPLAITITVTDVDRAPTVTAPATATVAEGSPLTFTVTGADADGDAVTLSLVSGPVGATFNAGTGVFAFTPDFAAAGTATATFRATARGLTANATTTLTITDTNRAPVVTSTAPTTATEDVALSYAVVANDPDGDALTFALTQGVANANLSPTGVLTWTPTGAQAGARAFTVRVTDARGASTNHAFTITVAGVNDAPIFTSAPATAATENAPFSTTITAFDEDSDPLTFTLVQAPAGMTLTPAASSLTLSWVPGDNDPGTHAVRVSVSDGSVAVELAFSVIVANVNDAPVFAANPAPASSVLEDATFTFAPAITDADAGDTVTLALITAPTTMTLTAGTVSWTPTNADVGLTTVRLRARDVAGATTDRVFNLTVVNTNDAPVITSTPITTTLAEESVFNATFAAADVDVGDTLTWSLSGAPASASIDSVTGAFRYRPDDADVGLRTFTVRATDGAGAVATQTVSMTTTAVNDAPLLAAIADQQVAFGATLSLALSATDPDSASLTFSFVSTPSSAVMSLVGNVLTFQPTAADAGAYDVVIRVSDGSLTDEQAIVIVAGNGGLPPNLVVPADATVAEGDVLQRTITASSRDTGAPVTVVVESGLPPGASFVNGAFSYTPGFADAGRYSVRFAATDAAGTARRTWTVIVTDTNRAPVSSGTPPAIATEGSLYVGDFGFSDPDGDTLAFTVSGAPAGATVNGGILRFTAGFFDVGTLSTLVTANDGKGGLTSRLVAINVAFKDLDRDQLPDTWELLFGTDPTRDDSALDPDGDGLLNIDEFNGNTDPFVSNAPAAPTLLAPINSARVSETEPTLVWTAVQDPDGDAVNYRVVVSLADDNTNIVFDEETNATSIAATGLVEGVAYQWQVRAGDGVIDTSRPGSSTSLDATFVVDAINSAPPAPLLVAPADQSLVGLVQPILQVAAVADEDGDAVFYVFTVNNLAGDVVTTSAALAPDGNGIVAFEVDTLLQDGTPYTWTVEPRDARGAVGSDAGPFRFTVDLAHQPPPAPPLLAPRVDEVLRDNDVVLRFGGVVAPSGANVVYRAELSSQPGFAAATTQIFDNLTASGGEVAVAAGVLDDGDWFVRGLAIDGDDRGLVSAFTVSHFVVDAINAPPPTPLQTFPADNALVSLDENGEVQVGVASVVDVDGDAVTYRFELSDQGGALVDTVDNIDAVDGEAVASFVVDAGSVYGWRAFATDAAGGVSAPTARRSFRVSRDNVRPGAPVLLEPAEGQTVATAQPTFRFNAAVDADGDDVVHTLIVTSADGEVLRLAGLRDVAGVVTATAPSALPAGALTWTVQGADSGGFGASAVGHFVVDVGGEGEGEGEGEVGEGEGEVSEGEGEGPGPVVTRIDDDTIATAPSCACSSSGDSRADGAALVGAFVSLLVLRRRRRR